MDREIGKVSNVRVIVTPETYKEMQKQKLIEENEILKEQQETINYLKDELDKYKKLFIICDNVLKREEKK